MISTWTDCCTTRSATPSNGRDEGYTDFLASYVWEQVTGGNETEEDAGLSDGGYR